MGRLVGGQWALGYREPLNAAERIKHDDDGLNVRERIIDIYSKPGSPRSTRRPARPDALVGALHPAPDPGRADGSEPEDIEDEHFMMRVRITAGLLATEQLATMRGSPSASAGTWPT